MDGGDQQFLGMLAYALLADDGGSFSVREQEDRLIAVVLRHVLEVLQVGIHRQTVVSQAGGVSFGFFLDSRTDLILETVSWLPG